MFYVRSDYTIRELISVKNSVAWEGLFIEISKEASTEKLVLGNIYKPPKQNNNLENIQLFSNELIPILNQIKNNKQDFLLAGDFNINLLKIDERGEFADFLDLMTNNSFFPTIKLPTRFSLHSCSILDNIYHYQTKNVKDSKSGIIFTDISDHLPCFTSIKFRTHLEKRPPKFVKQKIDLESSMSCLINDLSKKDIYSQLNHNLDTDPNINYDLIADTLHVCKGKHFPVKLVKFRKHRHRNNAWMTYNILKSIKKT